MDIAYTSRLSSTASCSLRCLPDDSVPRNHPRQLLGSHGRCRTSCGSMKGEVQCLKSGPAQFSTIQHRPRPMHMHKAASCGTFSWSSGLPQTPQNRKHAVRDVKVNVRAIPALDSNTAHPGPEHFAQIKACKFLLPPPSSCLSHHCYWRANVAKDRVILYGGLQSCNSGCSAQSLRSGCGGALLL